MKDEGAFAFRGGADGLKTGKIELDVFNASVVAVLGVLIC